VVKNGIHRWPAALIILAAGIFVCPQAALHAQDWFSEELPISVEPLPPVGLELGTPPLAEDGDFTQTGAQQGPDLNQRPFFPPLSMEAEWQGETDGVSYSSYDLGLGIPAFFVNTSPPPLLDFGFNYTNLETPDSFDLPSDLYDYSMGAIWIKPLNSRWSLFSMLTAGMLTDGHNTSSDAFQLRGGVFGIYSPNDKYTWRFGAVATGRNDIPVIPAVGVTYQPRDDLILDLTMPRPKISKLLLDNGTRQQWLYILAGLNGRTWAVERSGGVNDQLTYGDLQAGIGWESTPVRPRGAGFVPGRMMSVELGYVFSRELELERAATTTDLSDTWMLKAGWRF